MREFVFYIYTHTCMLLIQFVFLGSNHIGDIMCIAICINNIICFLVPSKSYTSIIIILYGWNYG